MRLFCICIVLCIGSGLETGWSLIQGVLSSVQKRLRNWKKRPGPTKCAEPLMNEWISWYEHVRLLSFLMHHCSVFQIRFQRERRTSHFSRLTIFPWDKNGTSGWQKRDGDYVILCFYEKDDKKFYYINILSSPLFFSDRTHTKMYVDYEGDCISPRSYHEYFSDEVTLRSKFRSFEHPYISGYVDVGWCCFCLHEQRKIDIKMLAYRFCSITTQLVQFNKFKLFPEIVIKTAVSPLWHCKDRLKALKNRT
jgi:hypothetical protein